MPDSYHAKLADVLVGYSTRVREGDVVLIESPVTAAPLLREVFRRVVRAGGHPQLRLSIETMIEALLRNGNDEQLEWVNPVRVEDFERDFAAAGGRLMAGVDPTGWGGVVAGFGDQRELELLVEAGLKPEQAIQVATANAAGFLFEADSIGTVAVGKHADLVVVHGNPSARIADVRNVELVLKDGVEYDPAPLVAAAQGSVGRFDLRQMLRWPFNVLVPALLALFAARVIWTRTRPAPASRPGAAYDTHVSMPRHES